MKKLFVVGCPRSGTTMLQQALNRHSAIAIPPETHYFIDFLGHTRRGQVQHLRRINADLEIDLPPPSRCISRREDAVAFFEQMAAAYLERIGRTDVTYFGEKSPWHLMRTERIVDLFPEAKFLLIHRDGRDVAASLASVPWAPPDLYVNFSTWLRFYRRQRKLVAAGVPEMLVVSYEAMVAQPEEVLRQVAAFLDLPYEAQMAEGAGNREGIPAWESQWKDRALDPINRSRVGAWRETLAPDQVRLLECWGGDALTSLGYELTRGGTGSLPAWFFPRLYWKHTVWRLRCALRLAGKELLGR